MLDFDFIPSLSCVLIVDESNQMHFLPVNVQSDSVSGRRGAKRARLPQKPSWKQHLKWLKKSVSTVNDGKSYLQI